MAIAIPVWPFRHLKDHKAVYNEEEEESSAVQAAKEFPIGVKSLSRPCVDCLHGLCLGCGDLEESRGFVLWANCDYFVEKGMF